MGECRNVVGTDGAGPIQTAVPVQNAKYEPTVVPSTEAERLKRRLDTYKQWNSKKSSLQLATAGFIYTGIADKVECQSCGIRLYNWQDEDDPLQAHKKYAPDCEFMLTYFPQIKAPSKPKKILSVKYPHYAAFEARLRSFDSWPVKCVAQKPDMMARSGFFYSGSADRVRCFHCGVTLREWDADDYPPCAHRQWSEHCPFVQQLDVDGLMAEIKDLEREESFRAANGQIHSNYSHINNPPKHKPNKYNFADFPVRLKSFHFWPRNRVAHSPDIMARSGFFYVGPDDRVCCLLCGVTIDNWDINGYPHCAHQKLSGQCPFVQKLDVDAMMAEIEEAERNNNFYLYIANTPDCSSIRGEDLEDTIPKYLWRSRAQGQSRLYNWRETNVVVRLSDDRLRLPDDGVEVFQHGHDSGRCESQDVRRIEE